MTKDELQSLWRPASRRILPLVPHPVPIGPNWPAFQGSAYASSIALAKVLGIPYPTAEHYRKIEMTPELESILKALAGPYSPTILKVLEARRDRG